MKLFSSKHTVKSVAVCALLTLSGSGFAATTWDLQAGAAGVTLSGVSNARGSSGSPSATNNGTNFAAASIYNWGASSGLGVVSSNESSSANGPHAVDNGYGIDALLINFTSGPVNLTGLTIGWNGTDNQASSDNNGSVSGGGSSITYNDSDLSVFVWTGTGVPTLTSKSPTSLMSADSGWSLVGNYADVGSGSNTESLLGSTTYSSYWLISAYSSAYGPGTNLGQGNDAFKILAVAGNTCSGKVTNGACGNDSGNVPEPGSLTLMGVAMAGFVATRRRKLKTI